MQIVFAAGKLKDNEMLDCYLLIQQACRVFPNAEVFFCYFFRRSFINHYSLCTCTCYALDHEYYWPTAHASKFVEHCARDSPFAMGLRTGRPCVTEIRFKNGTVQPSTTVFFGLMQTLKVSRYLCFTKSIIYCFDWFAFCQLTIFTFPSTTIFFHSGFGWRTIRTKEHLFLPFRILYIRLQKLLVHLRFHQTLTGTLTQNGLSIPVHRQPDWAHSVQTLNFCASSLVSTRPRNLKTQVKMAHRMGTKNGSKTSIPGRWTTKLWHYNQLMSLHPSKSMASPCIRM